MDWTILYFYSNRYNKLISLWYSLFWSSMTWKSSSILKKEEQCFENIPRELMERLMNSTFLTLLRNSVRRWTYLAFFRLKLFSTFDSNPTVNSNKYREPDDVLIIKSGRRESPIIIVGFEKPGRSTKEQYSLKAGKLMLESLVLNYVSR